MAQRILSPETLGEIANGEVVEFLRKALVAAAQDFIENPHHKRARRIDLAIVLKPEEVKGQSSLREVTGRFEVKTVNPERLQLTSEHSLKPTEAGLQFNPHAPENAAQRTIDEFVGTGEAS